MSDNDGWEFVDTNILVYAYDVSTGEKHTACLSLMNRLWEQKRGCISIQVLQEFYVNITRKVAVPMETETAMQVIDDLSTWQVITPAVPDVLAAIRLQQRHILSFWDAMILQSALRGGCSAIWSEDFNPGQEYDGLQVQLPWTV